jgi:hypothetical protein
LAVEHELERAARQSEEVVLALYFEVLTDELLEAGLNAVVAAGEDERADFGRSVVDGQNLEFHLCAEKSVSNQAREQLAQPLSAHDPEAGSEVGKVGFVEGLERDLQLVHTYMRGDNAIHGVYDGGDELCKWAARECVGNCE